MRKRTLLVVMAVLGLVALAAGVAVAAAGSDPVVAQQPADVDGSEGDTDDESGGQPDESDESLTGETVTKAGDAALASTGGGTVLAVESDDGGAGYEVEVLKADGSEAEVELDKAFEVVRRGEDD